MNKKIFTLLTGAILMFFVAFSASAQGGPVWDSPANKLLLGDTVTTLATGPNKFYHLQVDSIGFVENGGGISLGGKTLKDSVVLFLGKNDSLFIDSLNHARADYGGAFSINAPKAEESAASLWCTVVYPHTNSQNATFDFVNKQQKALLEVTADTTGRVDATGGKTLIRNPYEAGGLSRWGYSDVIGGGRLQQSKPLYTYTDRKDTVAVLCIDTLKYRGTPRVFEVVVRLVTADYVDPFSAKYGKVPGILYFTLREPTPFLLDPDDINFQFGSKANLSGDIQNFTMAGDVSDLNNPFLKGNLRAQYIDTTTYGFRLRSNNPINYVSGTSFNFAAITFARDSVTGSHLDSLGYLWLTYGGGSTLSNDFLRVNYEYWSGSSEVTKYLTLGKKTLGRTYVGAKRGATGGYASIGHEIDSVEYGQYAWRLVYHPTEDNIYINAYQAAYLPTNYPIQAMDYFGIGQDAWKDSIVQGRFTFFADTSALKTDKRTDYTWASTSGGKGWYEAATATLNPDDSIHTFLPEFNGYQKLYVTVQDLDASLNQPFVVTLGKKPEATINFGLYDPCKDVKDNRVSLKPDVYLIRNARGQYLHVPLYSVHDSAEWAELEADVHPELLPSYQWVVTKRYYVYLPEPGKDPYNNFTTNSSQVTIQNREFPWLKFENVQLTTNQTRLDLYPANYDWNLRERINAASINWADLSKAKADGVDTASFIRVPIASRTDKYLGYTFIDPKVSDTALYSFNYKSFIDPNRYLGWQNDIDGKDSTVYAKFNSYYDRLFFRLDTIAAAFGQLTPYGYKVEGSKAEEQIKDLVQLVRQPYRLLYEDPYKFICYNDLYLINSTENNYKLGSKGEYKDILGTPLFYLRNVYHTPEKDGKKAEDYFALVQLFDWTRSKEYPKQEDWAAAFKAYVTGLLGPKFAEKLIDNLQLSTNEVGGSSEHFINPGILVAAVDDNTAKLKVQIRAENESRVSTFRNVGVSDPIYRRFNTSRESDAADDAPDTLRFFTVNSQTHYLFENRGTLEDQHRFWTNPYTGPTVSHAFEGKKQYLGLVDAFVNSSEITKKHVHTSIFVDTAFINRGTGHIKPQYLLAVRPNVYPGGLGCDNTGAETIPLLPYVQADYLINAYDSANLADGRHDEDYLWDGRWERLVFTPAIHANDTLYILNGVNLDDPKYKNVIKAEIKGNKWQLDVSKLYKLVAKNLKAKNLKLNGDSIIAIDLSNNKHKDCVFSFRFAERHNNRDFFIESETTSRDTATGPVIRPCNGGWLKIQNGVPIISRGNPNVDLMGEGDIFDVVKANDEDPVANDEVATVAPVTVTGNVGSISVLNAAGKKVVVNNILGQTIASTELTSDNATVPVPVKGIVVVTVEGKPAVKAQVK
ncbi:MAG: DUF6383 domain-containing protein [Tannerella sp.]|nr:DUF6383 domain-containing protein [Tannerella sp.]